MLFLNRRIDEEDLLDESVQNMLDRYTEIGTLFPDSLKGETALMFIDWLKEKVVFVEILAYSDENAYTIFETMNDRGLNLTPTEMLKGYLLHKRPRREKDKGTQRSLEDDHFQNAFDFHSGRLGASSALGFADNMRIRCAAKLKARETRISKK